MADREIKTTLKLEGEQQFRKAMKGASDAIKVLNSEQKLAAAQFEATGNKEQFLADKADILRRKIEEQQKAVKAAQEAVQKLKDKGVEPTNKSMQEWTRKLNDSQAYLVRLQGDLNNTENELQQQGQAFEEAGNAADNYGQQLENIGAGINFQNVISSLDAVKEKLNGALKAVEDLGKSILDAETQAAKWADDLLTSAQTTGLDVETLQSWEYAAQLIDTDVDTIIKAQDKLLKQMQTTSKDTELVFNQLGVVTRNADGTLRDYHDTFWDVIDALGKGKDAHGNLLTETEKDRIAQDLFGKSYRELLPLINAGRDAWNEVVEEGRQHVAVSEDNVKKLGELDDALNKFNARLDYTKNTVLANMAPAFTEAANNVSGLVDAFNDFLKTDEGQAALENLGDAVNGLLNAFIGDVDFEAVINTAADAINRLTDVLKWISEHGWVVVGALVGMKAAVTGITVAQTVLRALELMKSINWLNMQKGADSLGKSLSSGGTPEKAAEAAGETVTKGGGLLGGAVTKFGGWLTNLAGVAAGPLAALTAAGVIYEAVDREAVKQYDEAKRITEEGVAEVEAAADDAAKRFGEIRQKLAETLVNDATYNTPDDEKNPLLKLFEEYGAELEKSLPDLDVWKTIKANAENALTAEGGIDWEKLFDPNNANNLNAGKWADIATQLLDELTAAMQQNGTDVAQDLADGINKNTAPQEAAGDMAQGVEDTVADTLQTHSPSVVMHNIGQGVAQGLANGINAGAAAAIAAAQNLAAQVNAALSSVQAVSIGNYGGSMGRALSASPSYGGLSGLGGSSAGSIINNISISGRQVAQSITPFVNHNMAMALRASTR